MSENIKVTFDTAEEDLHVNLDAGAIQYGKLKIGTTITGESGTEAKVENVGSQTNAILNFTIPKGDKGEQGEKGEKGDTGSPVEVKDIPANTNVDEFFEEGTYAWNGDDGKAITGLPNDIVDMPSFSYMLKITKHSTMTNEKNKFEHYFQEFWLEGMFIYTRKITVRTGLETGRIFYERYSWERQALVNYDGVTVSSTEPTVETEKSKVWLQKGKNLFNKNNFLPNSSTSAEGVLISNNSTNTYYIPVEYGNSYIMSFVNNGVSGNVLYGFSDTVPNLGVNCTYNITTADKLNNMKFKPVSENNKYLCIRLRYDDAQIPYMSNIQVEQGSTATEYEEYKDKKIYTKNDNGVYEEFINADEVKPIQITTGVEYATNEYLDGKRVYKKRIKIGTLPSASATPVQVDTGISVSCDIVDTNGIAKNTDGTGAIPLMYNNNSLIMYYYITSNGQSNYQVFVYTTGDRSSYTGYITIYYTKTDVATTSLDAE